MSRHPSSIEGKRVSGLAFWHSGITASKTFSCPAAASGKCCLKIQLYWIYSVCFHHVFNYSRKANICKTTHQKTKTEILDLEHENLADQVCWWLLSEMITKSFFLVMLYNCFSSVCRRCNYDQSSWGWSEGLGGSPRQPSEGSLHC